LDTTRLYGHEALVNEICSLNWRDLTESDLTAIAWAYYFFSVQFRENLEIACTLHPTDPLLQRLAQEECATDNLSPWPGVAHDGEKLDHDEFVRRLLRLSPIGKDVQSAIEAVGLLYLSGVYQTDRTARAASIASYENGGLEKVFLAILECEHWDTPLLQAFRHFLLKHVEFDSCLDRGHGALTRNLKPDGAVHYLWTMFRDLLIKSVPKLCQVSQSFPN
jgi:hypothetical protein